MAVQILNQMPDAEVHRGDPVEAFLRDLNAPRERRSFLSGRAGFIAITVGLHFVRSRIDAHAVQRARRGRPDNEAALFTPLMPAAAANHAPPMNFVYSLPTPWKSSSKPTRLRDRGHRHHIARAIVDSRAADGRVGGIRARRAAGIPRNRNASTTRLCNPARAGRCARPACTDPGRTLQRIRASRFRRARAVEKSCSARTK